MLNRRHFLSSAAAAATLPALAPVSAAANAATLDVVATTGMIADTTRALAGDLAQVTALMGPGVDPHAYRQTRSDIVAMTRADLVLWNGLYLEAQLEEFLLDLGSRKPVVAVAEAISEDKLIAHEDYEGRFDPHVWIVPELWAEVADAIAAALSEAAPEHAETFAVNLAAYRSEIEAMGGYAGEALTAVPAQSRVLVTAHDAFGYLGQAYGYEVMGIQGISTESEAGLERIRQMVDMLVRRDIRAVFVETSVSDRNIRALIEGAAAQGHEVTVGGELFSDAMGVPGSYEGTYLGMIDHNATTIARALGAEGVPEAGKNGVLGRAS
jgi:manganese/zinc/iron transport system substrate-binding protein